MWKWIRRLQLTARPVATADAATAERRADLDRAMGKLRPRDRALLWLAYGVGQPHTEIASALGVAGKSNGGVYQVSVPRSETIRENGMEVPPSMGVATAINFQPTGGGKAAITGDFVLRANEVIPVIRALRQSGIEVTALHSHMLTEEPRRFFMHFWANDDAVKLASGLRAALDKIASTNN